MGTVQPADWFWLAFGIGLCVLAIWGARRIEPHWSAKDGSAFTCRYQVIGRLSDDARFLYWLLHSEKIAVKS